FAREVATLASIRHPNVVRYVAHGRWRDGRLYLAMEWLDGEDLQTRNRHAPLGMREAVGIVIRCAAAMATLHGRGIVHRDLKPSNIFLPRGGDSDVKLIDFGLAKTFGTRESSTRQGEIVGTPRFLSPEQARGQPVDARADVYSLGAVLFWLVTGR